MFRDDERTLHVWDSYSSPQSLYGWLRPTFFHIDRLQVFITMEVPKKCGGVLLIFAVHVVVVAYSYLKLSHQEGEKRRYHALK